MNRDDNPQGPQHDDVTYAFWCDAPREIQNEIEAAWDEINGGSGFRTGLWFSYARRATN